MQQDSYLSIKGAIRSQLETPITHLSEQSSNEKGTENYRCSSAGSERSHSVVIGFYIPPGSETFTAITISIANVFSNDTFILSRIHDVLDSVFFGLFHSFLQRTFLGRTDVEVSVGAGFGFGLGNGVQTDFSKYIPDGLVVGIKFSCLALTSEDRSDTHRNLCVHILNFNK